MSRGGKTSSLTSFAMVNGGIWTPQGRQEALAIGESVITEVGSTDELTAHVQE